MLNVLSICSLAGIFFIAVNLMCFFSPGTLIQVLGLPGTM